MLKCSVSWVLYALITALSLATADAISKKAMSRTDEYAIAWVRQGYALPFLAIVFLFIDIPQLDRTFWLTLFILIPLEITTILLYVKAIKLSPLSLTIPFLAVSPVFIILIAFILLGELPDRSGVLGILLIAAGAFILNAQAIHDGLLGPFKAIKKERGSVLMLAVAFIYSITSTLGKIAVQHSNPIFFSVFYPFIIALFLTIFLWMRGGLEQVISHPGIFVLIGFFISVMVITHFIAISMTDVAYMISVKRSSLIFSVIYGKIIFHEEKSFQRVMGSILMIAGVVSITLF